MNSHDIKEESLDRPSKVQIVLSQYKDLENPDAKNGWECDVFVDDSCVGGGTAPTQEAVYDIAQEIVWEYQNSTDYL
jgi:hypothetical protein